MLKLIKGKTKKFVAITALSSLLCVPLSYTAGVTSASAASFNSISSINQFEQYGSEYSSHRNDRYDKRKHDDDKDGYSKGNITTAVLVGGVIGAIIAKNT